MSGKPLPVKKLSQNVNPVIPRMPGTPWARSKDFYWEISIFLVSPDFTIMRLCAEEARPEGRRCIIPCAEISIHREIGDVQSHAYATAD